MTSNGRLETVAGCDLFGDGGDGGPALNANLNEPHGLAFLNDDILLMSDHFNNRVKAVKIDPTSITIH